MLKFIFDMGLWLASNSPERRLHVWIIPDRSMVSTLRPRENGHRFTKVVLKTVACVVVQNRPQTIIWTNDIAPSLTLRRKITIFQKASSFIFRNHKEACLFRESSDFIYNRTSRLWILVPWARCYKHGAASFVIRLPNNPQFTKEHVKCVNSCTVATTAE